MTLDGRPQTYCSVEVAAHLSGVSVARVRHMVRQGLPFGAFGDGRRR